MTISRTKLTGIFIQRVYDNLGGENPTMLDAYEYTETEFQNKYNLEGRMYKDYKSFSDSKGYHFKKGQHIPK